MPPYTKTQDSTAIDDGWTIRDEDDEIIAHLDTESTADALLKCLRQADQLVADAGIDEPAQKVFSSLKLIRQLEQDAALDQRVWRETDNQTFVTENADVLKRNTFGCFLQHKVRGKTPIREDLHLCISAKTGKFLAKFVTAAEYNALVST